MKIVSRAEWGAKAAKSVKRIDTPTRGLWLHHTAGNEPDGRAGMRQIQAFHQGPSRGWSDIAYSFVIDRTGEVLEGRGAGVAGAHTQGHNSTSHAICVMGNYEQTPVPRPVIGSLIELVRHGHAQGWWPDQITGGHRQAAGASTTCPGRNLLDIIETVNRRAREDDSPKPGPIVQPILYARRGTPDLAAAFWAVSATGSGSASCDLNAVRAAASKGATVIAVGGPADRDLQTVPHRTATGADAVATMHALLDVVDS